MDFNERRALSGADLKQLVPAAFAEAPHPGVSERYEFLSTVAILDGVKEAGWLPVFAKSQRIRGAQQGFEKHIIHFQAEGIKEVRGVRPELVLTNSHDRTAAFSFAGGLYRLVCANGLIACDNSFGAIAGRHLQGNQNLSIENVIELAFSAKDKMWGLVEKMDGWLEVPMRDAQQEEFATKAAEMRWGEIPLVAPKALLDPPLWIDRKPDGSAHPDTHWPKNDLWTTLNVVQQNIMQGGIRTRRGMTTWPMGSIQDNLKVNKGLWQLAEDFAKAA